MSVRLKALLLFFSLYISSVLLLSFFSLLVVRTTLHRHVLNYMEYQVEPLMEFYESYYKNPNQYARFLAEEVVSREIASLLLDKKGRVINVENFLEGELQNPDEREIRRMLYTKAGIGERYAYLVKEVGDYRLVLLGKLDRIGMVERRILLFTVFFVIFISVPASLLAFFLLNRLFNPLSYLREISEALSRGQLDIEIKRSGRRDEFGLLEEAYSNMVDKLKGIILWQREFIRNITHALKTPLTYIRGQVELLQLHKYSEEKLREIYYNMQLQSEKMERLISQLTTIMRLESQMPLKVERVSLNQLFAELEEEYEFIKKERSFVVEYLEEDGEIEVDKEYFKMALRNLIENAYKYSQKGAKIRLYQKDNCIWVEDEGSGIEHPERVGELFCREATHIEGSGLGLYIVKLIAQKSGMSMKLHSEKGVGTKVGLCYDSKS